MARISVIDDYPEFLEMMYAILDGLGGHDVAGFTGEATTVDELAASRPDLLIIDLQVNESRAKGWDLLLLARADPRLAHVPMIVCSGDAETLRAREDELRRIGNVHVLAKPFGLDEVSRVVGEALGSV